MKTNNSRDELSELDKIALKYKWGIEEYADAKASVNAQIVAELERLKEPLIKNGKLIEAVYIVSDRIAHWKGESNEQ